MRQTLDEVIDKYNVQITPRGNYIPPAKVAAQGAVVFAFERKLHLIIEGSTETKVKQARIALEHLFADEMVRNAGAVASAPPSSGGRYSVL